MVRKFLLVFVTALIVFASAQPSQAVLNAVDPGNPPGTYTAAFGFFPQWYQDTNAIALDLCFSPAVGRMVRCASCCQTPGYLIRHLISVSQVFVEV